MPKGRPTISVAKFKSPVGPIAIEATEHGVSALRLGSRERAISPASSKVKRHLDDAIAALRAYFAGKKPRLPKFDLRGSPFQLKVWKALIEIPFGEVATYGELAARVGSPGGARAIGGANHANPVAILVPCHRVVAAGGRLGGYGGGLRVKAWLLAHEAGNMPALRMPVAMDAR